MEAHTAVCALVLVSAVAADCITALDIGPGVVDSPASLRVSSVVLILTLASPLIHPRGSLVDQRVLISAALVFTALAGKHEANATTRSGDVFYVVFVMLMGTQIYSAGGIEAGSVRPDNPAESAHRRQTMSGFCAALFVYIGTRGARMAYMAPEETYDFSVYRTVGGSLVRETGYAHISTSTTIPLALGHGILISTGVVIGLHGEAHVTGSSAVAFEVGCAGMATAVAATWALLGYSEQIDTLSALFGPSACASSEAACPEAYDARRFAIVVGSSASLWLGALAALCFSFAVERRIYLSSPTRAERLWQRQGFSIGLAVFTASIVGIYAYYSPNGAQWHSDVCAMVALFGSMVSAFGDTFVGTLLYFGAAAYEEYLVIENYGAEQVFNHLTHCTLFISLCMLGVYIVVDLLKIGLSWIFYVREDSLLNRLLAVVATFGTSLTFGLYVASCILLAGSNGALPDDSVRDGSGKRTLIVYILNHFYPLFAWLPLYVCRCEIQMLDSYARAIAWLLAVPLDLLAYFTSLSWLAVSAPAMQMVDMLPSAAALAPCLVAWAAAASV